MSLRLDRGFRFRCSIEKQHLHLPKICEEKGLLFLQHFSYDTQSASVREGDKLQMYRGPGGKVGKFGQWMEGTWA